MHVTQQIRCPNCGNFAERHHLSGLEGADYGCPESRVTRIECAACDYFMATCVLNGRVVEAYAPGTYSLEEHWLWSQATPKWESLPRTPESRPLVSPVSR